MLDQDWAVWQRIVAAGWCGLTGGGGVSQHISVGWGTPPGQGLLVTAIICEIVRCLEGDVSQSNIALPSDHILRYWMEHVIFLHK